MIRGQVLHPSCYNRFGLGKGFYLMTEFGQGQEFLCRDKVFLCLDRVWPWMRFLCRDRVFLHRNKVWPRQGILGLNRVFSCHDRVWGKGQESLRHDREFDVITELPEIVLRQSIPYVATKSSKT